MSLSIHPLFVFDGPHRPEFKRNKRVGGGKAQVSSIPEFLAKQLLKQFGFPYHLAPGEAEAECALLQREGIVDAVLSEDVDTLMFGSGTTIKNWSPPEGSKSKTPTHVDLYDAAATKLGSGLDREGMILVAMMSGGDYITEGIPGVGPKLACEAARAGFGKELCRIQKTDNASIVAWRDRLQHELRTNESRYFRTKHSAITIPDDFPDTAVLAFYTNPVISSKDKLDRLRQSLAWDMDIDYDALRAFTADAFSWTNLGGAKHFIRNLATPLLVRELRMRGERPESGLAVSTVQQEEAKLIHSIHGRRNHISTDQTSEMRVAFRPIDLVPIDLNAEEPDDEIPLDDEADDEAVLEELDGGQTTAKTRAPTKYDPTTLEKTWIMESFVRIGAPLKVQDWEEAYRDPRKYLAMKHANKAANKPRSKVRGAGGMQQGALDRFAKITKPGLSLLTSDKVSDSFRLERSSQAMHGSTDLIDPAPRPPTSFTQVRQQEIEAISLLSSPPPLTQQTRHEATAAVELAPTAAKRRRRSPLQRARTSPASLFHATTEIVSSVKVAEFDLTRVSGEAESTSSSPQPLDKKKLKRSEPRPINSVDKPEKPRKDAITISSSPPNTIDAWIRRSQSVTPKKAFRATELANVFPEVTEESSLASIQREIRTVRIGNDLHVTQAAIAQIDLTGLELPKVQPQYPKPNSHLAPAGKKKAFAHSNDLLIRRRWDTGGPLTETSGNRLSVRNVNKMHDLPCKPSVRETKLPDSQPEKLFVEVDALADGFWKEVPTSRLKKDAVKPTKGRKVAKELVWALEDVQTVDLTS